MNKIDLQLWQKVAELRGYKFRENCSAWEYQSPHQVTTNAWGDELQSSWIDSFCDNRGNSYSFYTLETIYERSGIPKYIEDLNAVHELEMWLKNDKEAHLEYGWTFYSAYCTYLYKNEGPCASAKQRCFRLVKTLFPNDTCN